MIGWEIIRCQAALAGWVTDAQTGRSLAGGRVEITAGPEAFTTGLTFKAGEYDAVICLGAVIRGGTPHFDYIAAEVAKGVAQTALQYQFPVAFGVLTTESLEQALERAGTKAGNKGWDAAISAIEMADLG